MNIQLNEFIAIFAHNFFIQAAIAAGVLLLYTRWLVFIKAGQPGWAAIVGVYHLIILLRVAGKPSWWVFMPLIPVVNIVFYVKMIHGISLSFKKNKAFTWGLIFLPFIFYPFLAFSDSTHINRPDFRQDKEHFIICFALMALISMVSMFFIYAATNFIYLHSFIITRAFLLYIFLTLIAMSGTINILRLKKSGVFIYIGAQIILLAYPFVINNVTTYLLAVQSSRFLIAAAYSIVFLVNIRMVR